MICITVYCRNGAYTGFDAAGHAEYEESGRDIICAAASALIVNTVNSIETLTDNTVEDEKEEDGFASCRFPDGLDRDGALLMESLILGLKQMAEIRDASDNKPYVTLLFEEVQEDAES